MTETLFVSEVDPETVERLERRATRNGRTSEAEHREILRQALAVEPDPSFEATAAALRSATKRRPQTPSELLLRESRDER